MLFNMNKQRAVSVPDGHKECPSCGRFIPKNQKHKTVTRIVRVNNTYGVATAGDRVEIEPGDLTNAVQLATMSLDEFEMLEAEKNKPKPVKRGQLAEAVEKAMLHAQAEVKSAIERGKRRLEREREQAIAQGKDIPRNPPSIDAEPNSRERQEVKE